MKIKLTLYVTVLAAALFGGGCVGVPKPDVAHAVKWNGHWYAFWNDSVTSTNAIRISEEQGGHLICIESKEENQFVAELVHKRTEGKEQAIKIGLRNHKRGNANSRGIGEGEWKWINGKSAAKNFTSWDKVVAPPHDPKFPWAIMIVRNTDGQITFQRWIADSEHHPRPFVIEWE
jgi:hypothetical protein